MERIFQKKIENFFGIFKPEQTKKTCHTPIQEGHDNFRGELAGIFKLILQKFLGNPIQVTRLWATSGQGYPFHKVHPRPTNVLRLWACDSGFLPQFTRRFIIRAEQKGRLLGGFDIEKVTFRLTVLLRPPGSRTSPSLVLSRPGRAQKAKERKTAPPAPQKIRWGTNCNALGLRRCCLLSWLFAAFPLNFSGAGGRHSRAAGGPRGEDLGNPGRLQGVWETWEIWKIWEIWEIWGIWEIWEIWGVWEIWEIWGISGIGEIWEIRETWGIWGILGNRGIWGSEAKGEKRERDERLLKNFKEF